MQFFCCTTLFSTGSDYSSDVELEHDFGALIKRTARSASFASERELVEDEYDLISLTDDDDVSCASGTATGSTLHLALSLSRLQTTTTTTPTTHGRFADAVTKIRQLSAIGPDGQPVTRRLLPGINNLNNGNGNLDANGK